MSITSLFSCLIGPKKQGFSSKINCSQIKLLYVDRLKVGSCGEQIKRNWKRKRKGNKVNHRWGRFYAYMEGNFMSCGIKELTKELLLPGCLEGRCLSRKTDEKVIKNHRRASPLTAPMLAKSTTGHSMATANLKKS